MSPSPSAHLDTLSREWLLSVPLPPGLDRLPLTHRSPPARRDVLAGSGRTVGSTLRQGPRTSVSWPAGTRAIPPCRVHTLPNRFNGIRTIDGGSSNRKQHLAATAIHAVENLTAVGAPHVLRNQVVSRPWAKRARPTGRIAARPTRRAVPEPTSARRLPFPAHRSLPRKAGQLCPLACSPLPLRLDSEPWCSSFCSSR